MDKDKKLSRRKFVKRAAMGGAAVIAGGYAYSHLTRPRPPEYPAGCAADGSALKVAAGAARPNIIIINADDLGYGDLSCYGSAAIDTPKIDSLAEQGVRFTDFHTCDAVCTPSRAGLLTGRYPARMMLDTPLQPGRISFMRGFFVRLGYLSGKLGLMDLATRDAAQGMSAYEITLAEALKAGGYRTGMIGKWHLGDYSHDPAFNPVRHGFDSYFGVPYSNDMHPFPLFRNEKKLQADIADQSKLTGLYTREAVKFVEAGADTPFFLYFAHTLPHRPLFASKEFTGVSDAGLYGDVVQEIDWSVGRIMAALDRTGLAENTLVFFTSDNGPWYQGSPGPYRGRKGQSFEGGHRVPFIARYPGVIPPNSVVAAPAMNIDLFPTCLAAAGVSPPPDRTIDGVDITALLRGDAVRSPHELFYFYHHGELEGIRSGDWKYFRNVNHYTWPMPNNKKLGPLSEHTTGPMPLLHNLKTDPGEAYNLAERRPDVAKKLDAAMVAWQKRLAENPLGFVK